MQARTQFFPRTMFLLSVAMALVAVWGVAADERERHAPKAILTIVDLIANSPSLNTLTTTLQAADMIYLLNNEGPFTVFAPTDAAFRKLPLNMLQNLLKPENKGKLKNFLTYHIVRGIIPPEDIKSGNVTTLNGKTFYINVIGSQITINYVKVLSHFKESNGVVYIIDGSLVPPGDWAQFLH